MTYFTGSTANTANPGKDFMELILHPNLLTAGFTYVEEVIASGTQRIYKSASAANGVGDWYLIINRNSDTATAINFGVCEDYDSSGHLAKKWAPSSTIAGQTLPADRSHYTTAGTSPSTAVYAQWTIQTNTTAHAYVMSLHPKRVIIGLKFAATETAIYVGLYDPVLPALANHFPLCIAAGGSGNVPLTAFTREPGTGTSVATATGNGTFTARACLIPQGGSVAPLSGDPVLLDGYYSKPSVARVFLPGSQTKAGIRGTAIGLYAAEQAAFSWGDIADIDWAGTPVLATCVSTYNSTDAQRLMEQM